MEHNRPEPRSVSLGRGNSFANGPPVAVLPLEGWVIGDIHWWHFA